MKEPKQLWHTPEYLKLSRVLLYVAVQIQAGKADLNVIDVLIQAGRELRGL
jgi:hypothetical protein